MKAQKFTIKQFHKRYPNDDACLDEIFNQRFPDLKNCPKCLKDTTFYKLSERKCYSCEHCRYQIHPLAGTIFHKSSTSLKNWFYAIFLFGVSKNGVSAKELQRHLGVTYKTAWRMAKQIRLLFNDDTDNLKGTIEVDETYIGGKGSGTTQRGRNTDRKKPVIGLVERNGNVKAKVVTDVKSSTVMPFIVENVEQGSDLMTDKFKSYSTVKDNFNHQTVNHGIRQFVSGLAHTNTIESFWSQVKRSINGTYHFVSPKHLQSYINEFAFRYNNRNNIIPLFSSLIDQAIQP